MMMYTLSMGILKNLELPSKKRKTITINTPTYLWSLPIIVGACVAFPGHFLTTHVVKSNGRSSLSGWWLIYPS